ncbi:ABC-type amino acid transport substrate-binding protein [Nocardia tenerifensis]|uniref:ABC-type amino acid transport substrate-binding protein n=1 Tax=Nocardia tenerifensis TaxID=228006 RepID=A0A318JSZ8_9NOCA|nr:glutamate ABC transporter substrate-binding protein [Nocardia tenerifensis]PXX56318.1 ABC-type amino acid transport substrate-binding protein [Nocardia tenerifensis]
MKHPIVAGALVACLALAVACSKNDDEKPTLTIGVKFDQPGLSAMGTSGKPAGFDVDTAAYIADKLGVDADHITWKEAPSAQRESMLNDGTVDFIVASYSITAPRQQQVSFAGPYLVAGQDLLVRKDETRIDRPEALDGRTVCSAEGSTSAAKIKKDFAAGVNSTARPTYSACVDDLLAGTADAVTTDDVILAGYAAQHPDKLRVVGHPFTRERYGVGVKKGDTELQGRITSAIQDMISDGSWERSVSKNLAPSGFRPLSAPVVFNAPDTAVTAVDPNTLDPELVKVVNRLAETSNNQQWDEFNTMTCPDAAPAINALVKQYTPQFDERIGPDVKDAGFTNTITGITQTGPDSATFLAHESFTNVPDKYRQYFKDIDYTGTMQRQNGAWKLCNLAADFVES